jgi:hypothetical protein
MIVCGIAANAKTTRWETTATRANSGRCATVYRTGRTDPKPALRVLARPPPFGSLAFDW